MEAKDYYKSTRMVDTMHWTLDMAMNFAEEYHKNEMEVLRIHDVRQRCIDFAEWCMKNKYTYYFNGEKWIWANARKQEYYTTEELYEKWVNNVA